LTLAFTGKASTCFFILLITSIERVLTFAEIVMDNLLKENASRTRRGKMRKPGIGITPWNFMQTKMENTWVKGVTPIVTGAIL
jgi:hypothetical protein